MPVYNTVGSDSDDSFVASKLEEKAAKEGPESEDEEGEEDGSEYEIEEVLDAKRGVFEDGRMGYYVKWKGYGPEENSWVNEVDAGNASALVDEYWKKNPHKKRQAGRKSVDKKSPQKGRKSSQVDDSEADNASITASKKRNRKSVSQKPASEDDDMQVDEPEKPAKKARKSAAQTSKASAKKARSPTPESQEKPIGNMDAYKHLSNWEGLVKSVDTVEQNENELMVFFTLNTGEAVMETNAICKARFPQTLLNFYESNLRWRSAEDADAAS